MNRKKKYTHLFFDLDNTLWDFELNARQAMWITWQFFFGKNQQNTFNQFFERYTYHNKILWTLFRDGKINKQELIVRRFINALNDLGIKNADPTELNTFYLTEMPKQNHLLEGAVELLDYLKKKGYALNIITNGFQEVQQKKIEVASLIGYFDKIFTSEMVKANKPGREIFEYAIKSSNAPKRSSLMIGDDWETDVTGALNFGIDAVYINKHSGRLQYQKQMEKTKNTIYIFKNILQLKSIL